MSTFTVKVKVWNPANPERFVEAEADGFTGGDNVVVAETGDAEVLGTHSLESLGLAVDPVHKKLVPLVVALALEARESSE